MGKTKEISVFVDESGSYDPDETSSLYYMVCLVFHDQDSDISGEISKLEEAIAATGRDSSHCIHTAPLIRRENEYEQGLRESRRALFLSSCAGNLPPLTPRVSFGKLCLNYLRAGDVTG